MDKQQADVQAWMQGREAGMGWRAWAATSFTLQQLKNLCQTYDGRKPKYPSKVVLLAIFCNCYTKIHG
jgi:hypothetical protein